MQNKVVIWGQPGCSYCDMAKIFLQDKNEYLVEYRNIGNGWTKEQFLLENPGKRSVPQIHINGVSIGGYKELKEYFSD